tara:strand:- start:5096 stop:5728 length:633 start_codon:yes stop_codon:yes gene_type:complete
MKQADIIYLLGGLAVGGVLFFLFKDTLIGEKKEKKAKDTDGNYGTGVAPDGGGLGVPDSVESYEPQPNTSAYPNTQTNTQTTAQTTTTALPYAITPIEPSLASTQAYQEMFGGCDFPILPEASSICAQRLQQALDVEQTGSFDMATQEAYDAFIESIPNRSDGHFSGYGRQGCITSDPQSGGENLCGLNHDQYLEILFKMGIPLTQTYDE